MKFRKKSEPVDDYETIARRRLSRLPTADVIEWGDQVGSAIARGLQDYRNYRTTDSLYEAQQGAIALNVVVETLLNREIEPQ